VSATSIGSPLATPAIAATTASAIPSGPPSFTTRPGASAARRGPRPAPGHAAASAEVGLPLAADRLPLRSANARSDAAVRDDLDVAVREQQIDQHSRVVLGVPDAQLAEHFDSAFARRALLQERDT